MHEKHEINQWNQSITDDVGKVNTYLHYLGEFSILTHSDTPKDELNLTFIGLQGVISHKAEIFTATALRNSNSTRVGLVESGN
jgi:hypothetical protein